MSYMVYACETVIGQFYRLFPNGKRSRHIIAQSLGMSPKGHSLFLYTDLENLISILITDVDAYESVQEVFSSGASSTLKYYTEN